jgi:hypothetical protein
MSSVSLYVLAGVAQIIAIALGVFAYRQQQGETRADTQAIIAHQTSSTERILAALEKRSKSLRETLWARYPFGYVLFGGEGGDIVAMPFYKGDLHMEANWAETKITLDRSEHIAHVQIPQPTWKQDSGPTLRVTVSKAAEWAGHYEIGQPVSVGLVVVANQPKMFFEVIDDDEGTPICAVGFKK